MTLVVKCRRCWMHEVEIEDDAERDDARCELCEEIELLERLPRKESARARNLSQTSGIVIYEQVQPTRLESLLMGLRICRSRIKKRVEGRSRILSYHPIDER